MTRRKLMRVGVFLSSVLTIGAARALTVHSSDYTTVPEGETITLGGSGFTGTTKAKFFWKGFVEEAVFREVSDTVLEVDYAGVRSSQEHMLLVETPTLSTLTTHLSSENANIFEGTGLFEAESREEAEEALVVKSGAVLQGLEGLGQITDLIYVESGGAIDGWVGMSSVLVVAEDGALLDFRGDTSELMFGSSIIRGAGTDVLGEDPIGFVAPVVTEVNSISLSWGVGPFSLGAELEIVINGDGSVERSVPGPYYASSTTVELTAIPGEGQFFTGWSGGVVSTDPTVSVRTPVNAVTATFSSGKVLEVYTGLGGSVSRDPDKEAYAVDEMVTLTPQAVEGYEFIGWGGDVSSEEDALTLTMTDDMRIVGIFRSLAQDALPQITGADHTAVPLGSTITLTGSGLAGVTQARFIWSGQSEVAAFRSISDTTLEVDYAAWQEGRAHMLLVETPEGSTLAIEADESKTGNFEGVGEHDGNEDLLMVKPGAVLTGGPQGGPIRVRVIYVEAGGMLKMGPYLEHANVFAEDGAILDFRDGAPSGLFSSMIYYSTGTQILGEIPFGLGEPIALQIPSLSLSPGVGPFTEGSELEVLIEGEGTVERSIPGPYYASATSVELTAIPGEGQYFTGWSGGVISNEPTVSVRTPVDAVTATFSSGRILDIYTGLGGEVSRDPDKDAYGIGETVNLTPQALEGYEFVGWGGDVSSEEETLTLTVTEDMRIVGVFRSLAQDTLPQIISADQTIVPIGETITLTGTGLAGATQARFIWFGQSENAPVRSISETNLEVDYTARQGSREHILLVETPEGSTVAIKADESETASFEGSGEYAGDEDLLIVKPGAVLTGGPQLGPVQVKVIYVEAGGILKMGPYLEHANVFAEDGAIIDFRDGAPSGLFSSMIYYSTGTQILGEIPPGLGEPLALQIPSLSLSPGVGPFTEGYQVTLTVEGPGSVSGLEGAPLYFRRGDELNLVATPDAGNHFIRWTGSHSSTNPILDLSMNHNVNLTARFSTLAGFVTDWRGQHFTPEQLSDPEIGGLLADPDQDGNNNTTEYVFGGNPLKADSGIEISIWKVSRANKLIGFSYVRPRFVSDVEYSYFGSDKFTDWTNLSEVGTVEEVSTEELANNLERVFVEVVFNDEFPPNYMFRVSAELL